MVAGETEASTCSARFPCTQEVRQYLPAQCVLTQPVCRAGRKYAGFAWPCTRSCCVLGHHGTVSWCLSYEVQRTCSHFTM